MFPHCNKHFSISPSPFLNKITAINQLWVGGMNDEANISAYQAFICLVSEEMCTTRSANNYFYSTFGRSRSLSGWLSFWDPIFAAYQMILHMIVLDSSPYWSICTLNKYSRKSAMYEYERLNYVLLHFRWNLARKCVNYL